MDKNENLVEQLTDTKQNIEGLIFLIFELFDKTPQSLKKARKVLLDMGVVITALNHIKEKIIRIKNDIEQTRTYCGKENKDKYVEEIAIEYIKFSDGTTIRPKRKSEERRF